MTGRGGLPLGGFIVPDEVEGGKVIGGDWSEDLIRISLMVGKKKV